MSNEIIYVLAGVVGWLLYQRGAFSGLQGNSTSNDLDKLLKALKHAQEPELPSPKDQVKQAINNLIERRETK